MKKIIVMMVTILLYMCCTVVYAEETQQKMKYHINVNITQNIVSIYDENNALQKIFYCSTGGFTPNGNYYTSDKYPWRMLFGDVYGQYATRINGNILFHSVPYLSQNKDSLKYEEYNKLGQKASSGCIRLTVKDAKWIYDNCEKGTAVYLYRSNDAVETLPKPNLKIDANDPNKNWDPTDPDLNNPWKKIVQWIDDTPVFFQNMTVIYGENYDCTGFVYQDSTYFCKYDLLKILCGSDINIDIFKDSDFIVLDDVVYYRFRDVAEKNNLNIQWNDTVFFLEKTSLEQVEEAKKQSQQVETINEQNMESEQEQYYGDLENKI